MQNLRESWFLKDQATVLAYADVKDMLGDIAESDYLPVLKGSKIANTPEYEEIEMVSGATPYLTPGVAGGEKADGTLIIPMQNAKSGATVTPSAFVRAMNVLCGFNLQDSTSTTGNQTVLTPGLFSTAGMLLRASGPRPNGDCLQECFYNLLADVDIDIPVNKKATATFKTAGAAYSEQDTATDTPFTGSGAVPGLTLLQNAQRIAGMKGATFAIIALPLNVISAKFSIKNNIIVRTDSSEPNGIGFAEASGRRITGQFKVYADPAVLAISNHLMKLWRDETTGSLSLSYGGATDPAYVSFASAGAKITKVSPDDESGAMSWTVDVEFVGNDLTITQGYTAPEEGGGGGS